MASRVRSSTRRVAMTASFLRASLFTSVLAYGVAAMSGGLGIVLILIGIAISNLGTPPQKEDETVG